MIAFLAGGGARRRGRGAGPAGEFPPGPGRRDRRRAGAGDLRVGAARCSAAPARPAATWPIRRTRPRRPHGTRRVQRDGDVDQAAVLAAHGLRPEHRHDQVAGAGGRRSGYDVRAAVRPVQAPSGCGPASCRRRPASCSSPAATARCGPTTKTTARSCGPARCPAGRAACPSSINRRGAQYIVVASTPGGGRGGRAAAPPPPVSPDTPRGYIAFALAQVAEERSPRSARSSRMSKGTEVASRERPPTPCRRHRDSSWIRRDICHERRSRCPHVRLRRDEQLDQHVGRQVARHDLARRVRSDRAHANPGAPRTAPDQEHVLRARPHGPRLPGYGAGRFTRRVTRSAITDGCTKTRRCCLPRPSAGCSRKGSRRSTPSPACGRPATGRRDGTTVPRPCRSCWNSGSSTRAA